MLYLDVCQTHTKFMSSLHQPGAGLGHWKWPEAGGNLWRQEANCTARRKAFAGKMSVRRGDPCKGSAGVLKGPGGVRLSPLL